MIEKKKTGTKKESCQIMMCRKEIDDPTGEESYTRHASLICVASDYASMRP